MNCKWDFCYWLSYPWVNSLFACYFTLLLNLHVKKCLTWNPSNMSTRSYKNLLCVYWLYWFVLEMFFSSFHLDHCGALPWLLEKVKCVCSTASLYTSGRNLKWHFSEIPWTWTCIGEQIMQKFWCLYFQTTFKGRVFMTHATKAIYRSVQAEQY